MCEFLCIAVFLSGCTSFKLVAMGVCVCGVFPGFVGDLNVVTLGRASELFSTSENIYTHDILMFVQWTRLI